MFWYFLYWIVYKLNVLNRIYFVYVFYMYYYLGIENLFFFEIGGLLNEYGLRMFVVFFDCFGFYI